EIVAPVFRGRHDGARTARLGGDRVDDKSVLRKYRRSLRPEKSAGNQIQHIVGTAAQRQLLRLQGEFFADGALQLEAVRVRVARHIAYRFFAGGDGKRRWAERIFVARELDDAGDAELALQLLDGLAGLIRTQALNADVCQREKITAQ